MKALFSTGAALSALILATPALAQTASADQAELAALVRAQAAEIAALRTRLDRIEGRQPAIEVAAPVQAQAQKPARIEQAANRRPIADEENATASFAPQIVAASPAEQDV